MVTQKEEFYNAFSIICKSEEQTRQIGLKLNRMNFKLTSAPRPSRKGIYVDLVYNSYGYMVEGSRVFIDSGPKYKYNQVDAFFHRIKLNTFGNKQSI